MATGELFCTVRAGGSRSSASPVYLAEPAGHALVSLTPDPHQPTANSVPRNAQFTVTFDRPVSGVSPYNFIVRGRQSGEQFRGEAYAGNGTTTITTPPANFFAGEEIEVVITPTAGGGCNEPYVARMRAAAGPAENFVRPYWGGFPAGDLLATMTAGDFNREGTIKFALNLFSYIFVYSAFERGGPTEIAEIGRYSIGGRYSTYADNIVSGDLDNDGFFDMIIPREQGYAVARGLANASLSTASLYSLGFAVRKVAIGDLNGDGRLDLVVAGSGSESVRSDPGRIVTLLGTGDGRFTPADTIDLPFLAWDVAIDDIDGDGKLDLVVAQQDGLAALLGKGDGTFHDPIVSSTGTHKPTALALGDLNGDGIPDVAIAGEDSKSNAILHGDGSGGFTLTAIVLPQGPGGSYNTGAFVSMGDVNGDGFLDVFMNTGPDKEFLILYNDGTGGFTPRISEMERGEARQILPADYNGDGTLDFFVVDGGRALLHMTFP